MNAKTLEELSAEAYDAAVDWAGELKMALPALREFRDCPVPADDDGCEFDGWQVHRLIIHLNDDHHWTREQIADWLESLDLDFTLPKIGESP